MLEWATVASASRSDSGRFVRPGVRRRQPDHWPFIAREYRPLLNAGRTVRNLQPSTPDAEISELLERYNIQPHRGWTHLSRSQQLDIIATRILAADRAEAWARSGANTRAWPKPYSILSLWQAYDRSNKEKPFSDMDSVIDLLRAHHKEWSQGWYRIYGEWGDFDYVGEPSGHATVVR